MGLLMGQMLYRWKMDLIIVTVLAVGLTMGAMAWGARGMTTVKGTTPEGKPAAAVVFAGPVNSLVEKLNAGINRLTRADSPCTPSSILRDRIRGWRR